MTPAAGVGFKAEHFEQALAAPAADLWFEVHAENYMVAGDEPWTGFTGSARRCEACAEAMADVDLREAI